MLLVSVTDEQCRRASQTLFVVQIGQKTDKGRKLLLIAVVLLLVFFCFFFTVVL